MKIRRVTVACFIAMGLVDAALVSCGGNDGSFSEGGVDSTILDSKSGTSGDAAEDFTFTGDDVADISHPPDRSVTDGPAEASPTDAGPDAIADVGPADSPFIDALQDAPALDAPALDAPALDAPDDAPTDAIVADVGPFCGTCEAGTIVHCQCGVHWTCSGGGCWNPDFTCSGTCLGPSMCLPPGSPVDLGVVECATGFADGSFLPCCSGASSAFLCNGTCM